MAVLPNGGANPPIGLLRAVTQMLLLLLFLLDTAVSSPFQGSIPLVDECHARLHGCSRNSECVDTVESYTCRCDKSFTGPTCDLWYRTGELTDGEQQCAPNEFIVVPPDYRLRASASTLRGARRHCDRRGMSVPSARWEACARGFMKAVGEIATAHTSHFWHEFPSGQNLLTYGGLRQKEGHPHAHHLVYCAAVLHVTCGELNGAVKFFVPEKASFPAVQTTWARASQLCNGSMAPVRMHASPCLLRFLVQMKLMFPEPFYMGAWLEERQTSVRVGNASLRVAINTPESDENIPICYSSHCADGPCHHGNCSSTASDYSCACTHGWSGRNCTVLAHVHNQERLSIPVPMALAMALLAISLILVPAFIYKQTMKRKCHRVYVWMQERVTSGQEGSSFWGGPSMFGKRSTKVKNIATAHIVSCGTRKPIALVPQLQPQHPKAHGKKPSKLIKRSSLLGHTSKMRVPAYYNLNDDDDGDGNQICFSTSSAVTPHPALGVGGHCSSLEVIGLQPSTDSDSGGDSPNGKQKRSTAPRVKSMSKKGSGGSPDEGTSPKERPIIQRERPVIHREQELNSLEEEDIE